MTVKDEEGPTRVMNQQDFYELAYGRLKVPWKNIVYIQTVVKIKHGIGESIMITYYSHLHTDTGAVEKLKEAGIQSDIQGEEFLMAMDPNEYCMLICRRVSYFLAIFLKLELLRM